MTAGKGRDIDRPVNHQLSLYDQLSLHHDSLVQCQHHSRCCTNPTVNPPIPLPVIFEQDSEIHGVLHFGQQQQLIPDPEWGTPHFPAEDDGLRQILIPAASHLAAKHSSVSWKPPSDEANRIMLSAKIWDKILRPLKWKPSATWLRLEMSTIFGQPWQSPAPTRTESYYGQQYRSETPPQSASPKAPCHCYVAEVCQPRQLHNIHNFKEFRGNLIHPYHQRVVEIPQWPQPKWWMGRASRPQSLLPLLKQNFVKNCGDPCSFHQSHLTVC